MGAEISDSTNIEPYTILSNKTKSNQLTIDAKDNMSVDDFKKRPIMQTDLHTLWTKQLPNNISPPPRMGHFSVYDPNTNIMIIGYGLGTEKKLLSDIWALDLNELKWSRFEINESIQPRSGSTAVNIGRNIYVFGGFHDKTYMSDFHIIDLETSKIIPINAEGELPPPRAGHIMAVYQHKIMIWGGYNGQFLSDLWIYDTIKNLWKKIPSNVKGRTAASSVEVGHYVYIYGASKYDPMLRFDWENGKLEVVATNGPSPSPEIAYSQMATDGKYIFLFGGKYHRKKYSLLHIFNTSTNHWIETDILPDGDSTTVEDGLVDPKGRFGIQTIWYGSSIYCKQTRTMKIILGVPIIDPPIIHSFDFSDVLAQLNQREDILNMLNM